MNKFRNWRHGIFAAAGLALGLFAAPVALADEQPAPWIKITTTSGCTFFFYNYDDPTGAEYTTPWTWTGGCTNGLASGSGDLTTMLTRSDGSTYTSGYRGTLVNGHLHGRFEEITNGKMLADYYWTEFNMGCGRKAHHMYCQPATVTAAAAVPAPRANTVSQSPAQTASPSRIGNDAAAIMAALGIEDEDRVFAMLAELIQTGQIDLAREAEIQLARRFPDSPLVAVAGQMIKALASAPATSSNIRGVQMNDETLRQIAESKYGASKNVSTTASPAYQVSVQRDGRGFPVVVEVSPNKEFVWVSARLTTTAVAPGTAQLALQRTSQIQPTMMWENNGLRLGRALPNRDLTAADIEQAIGRVVDAVISTEDIWAP